MNADDRLARPCGITSAELATVAVAMLLDVPEEAIDDFRRVVTEATMFVVENPNAFNVRFSDVEAIVADGPLAGAWAIRCATPAMEPEWEFEGRDGAAIASRGDLHLRLAFSRAESVYKAAGATVDGAFHAITGVRIGAAADRWPGP